MHVGPGRRDQPGQRLPLRSIPLGTDVHNVELFPGRARQVARAAGHVRASCMAKEGDYAQLRLPSGEVRKFHVDCQCVIGQVGNLDHENIVIGKAGRNRWLGRAPQRARRGHEPGRPPDGRRRRQVLGRPPSVLAVGQADQGLKTRKRKLCDALIVRRRTK